MDPSGNLGSDFILLGEMSALHEVKQSFVQRTLWWIKRDFRITDNHCLFLGTQSSEEFIPFFCWEPSVLNGDDYGEFHLQAQWQGLHGLSASLRKRGSGLVERVGEVVEQLHALFQRYPFQRIRSYQETGNDLTFRRDRAVRKWCQEHGVEWIESVGSTVVRGMSAEQKHKTLGRGPRGRLAVLTVPENLCPPKDKFLFSQPMEWQALVSRFDRFSGSFSNKLQTVNERAAWDTLGSFLQDRGVDYSGGISSPNTAFNAGSRLSPHLTWGTISSGSVFAALDQRREDLSREKGKNPWRRSLRAFESRLHWRDHFVQRLEGSPQMEFFAINPAYNEIEYEDDPGLLDVWLHGRTGFPMIDACMRCLGETGFMNFRMRAMVVSFACFGLHLSWRIIHGPLARFFLDYEAGIHLSQLQMQAGVTGINAIRVYSPAKQFFDHDQDAKFVKRWVPELRQFSPAEIAHAEDLKLGKYISPIVDLKTKIQSMKAQIFSIRKSEPGKEFARVTLQRHGSKKRFPNKRNRRNSEDGQLALFKD